MVTIVNIDFLFGWLGFSWRSSWNWFVRIIDIERHILFVERIDCLLWCLLFFWLLEIDVIWANVHYGTGSSMLLLDNRQRRKLCFHWSIWTQESALQWARTNCFILIIVVAKLTLRFCVSSERSWKLRFHYFWAWIIVWNKSRLAEFFVILFSLIISLLNLLSDRFTA